MAGPTLTSLPQELVLRIIELTHPASHLDLACTCKILAQSCSNILQRHREAHNKSTVSDLLPESIPNVVRALTRGGGDTVLAWHVRSLEVWGTRSSWDDWKPFRLGPPGPVEEDWPPSRFDPAASPLEWSIDEEELEVYGRILRDELHLPEDHLTKARQELEKGDDGILKVLAIALCPHLESVKYVWARNLLLPLVAIDQTLILSNNRNRDSSHAWLTLVIEESLAKSTWAPGLVSLRKVAIGVKSGTWLDRTVVAEVIHGEELLTALVKLPWINSVYYQGFRDHRRGGNEPPRSPEEAAHGLTRGCSSLEHLFLHEIDWMNYDFRTALLGAPRVLKTFCLRGNTDEFHEVDIIVGQVFTFHRATLENLMMYDAWGLNGYRERVYDVYDYPPSDCWGLRHVYVDMEDLVPGSYLTDQKFWEAWNGTAEQRDEQVQSAINCLPISTEVLCIGDCKAREGSPGAPVIEEILIQFLRSPECEQLKAIYIEDDLRNRCRGRWHPQDPPPPAGELNFQRLVEVAERYGVDIVSAAGSRERRNEVEFPESMESYHLASGPHARLRDEGEWDFDPFVGRWMPRGCGRCGDCEGCFEVFTREAWQTRFVSPGDQWMVGEELEDSEDGSENEESEGEKSEVEKVEVE